MWDGNSCKGNWGSFNVPLAFKACTLSFTNFNSCHLNIACNYSSGYVNYSMPI